MAKRPAKSPTKKSIRSKPTAAPKLSGPNAGSKKSAKAVTVRKAAKKLTTGSASQSRPKSAATTRSASKTKTATSQSRKSQSSVASKGGGAIQLHLISDFTGNLANHMVGTVMSQFPDSAAHRVMHRFCDSPEKLREALSSLKSKRDVVLHAVIGSEAKALIETLALERQVPCYDLTGSLTEFLSQTLGQLPKNDPDRLHATDDQYFDRIDAMEFTLQHDDSRRLESIHEADIVLVGLSRVSKSPTSTFLGSLGYRTANVSFAPELGLPKELKKCSGKVVGLTMQPKRLFEIRQRRFKLNRFATAFEQRNETINYLDLRDVTREVVAAEALYRQWGFKVVDVTHMTIEEAATHVLDTLGKLTV